MGSSKTGHFTPKTENLALIARAISHPARVEILNILRKEGATKSRDLCPRLKLAESSVHEHLQKMKEAGLIRLTYEFRGYYISPVPKRVRKLRRFLK